jgi:geranylgeranyl diphosphate synthase type I
MRYHHGWADEQFHLGTFDAGKRIRPLSCLLACQAAGGDWRTALPAAAAVELVHNFSLVHDDIEDHSDERRHRPTVWKLWGEAQAINVGDGLFIVAHQALARLSDRGVAPMKVLTAIAAFDQACLELCQGQFLDLSFESHPLVTVDEYLTMIGGKTAALFALSTRLGAMIATDDEPTIEHYRAFGEKLGLAFQIADDILGIWGDAAITGKSASDDILSKKKTLPVIYAFQQGLAELYRKPTLTEADVPAVLAVLDRCGARDYTQRLAEAYHRAALAELDATGHRNDAVELLRTLAASLVSRAA